MKILSAIWKEFIYGGHLLSLGAVSIIFTASILLNIQITWDFFLVVYLWTEAVYLYNRLKELKSDSLNNPKRTIYLKKQARYIPSTIILFSTIAIAILIYFNKLSALSFGLILFILSLLYTVFLKKFTKKIIAFKSFFVPLIWALLIIFLITYYNFSINIVAILLIIFIYLRLFIHEEIINLKDASGDKEKKLLTLAVILKKKRLLLFLQSINLLSIIPMLLGIHFKILPLYSFALIFIIIYTSYYLYKLKNIEKNTEFFYNVIIDGEYIFWTIIVLISKLLSSWT